MINRLFESKDNLFLSNNFISGFDPLKPKQHIPLSTSESHCGDCGFCTCSSRPEKYFEDKSIIYKYNNYGYRSDDFSLESTQNNFLYSGCSVTFASGLNIENSWASYLNQDIGGSSFLNLAICGASYKHILFDIYSYIEKFSNPPGIFILFPNLERYPLFIKHENEIRLSCMHYMFDQENGKKFRDVLTEDSVMFDFVSQIRMLEKYCKQSKILFRWGTWDLSLDQKLNKHSNMFSNYVQMLSNPLAADIFYDLKNDLESKNKFWELARDGHPGIKEQKMFAKLFKISIQGIL